LRDLVRYLSIAAAVCLMVFVAFVGAGCKSSPTQPSAPYSSTDLTTGTGPQANSGNRVTVAYTGWLYDPSKTDNKGSQFDSSGSFSFTLGAGQVIKGWDQGVPGMRVGGQRRLVLPPDLAYGSTGAGSAIPANATLVFDITLLGVQ
jgi:FKBP-type peptidyl-prolyl cis-trans isomerase FkpA